MHIDSTGSSGDGMKGTECMRLKGGIVCRGAALSLSRIQDALGDETFQKLLSGSDPPLLCALKSIPTYSMEASELPNSAQVRLIACVAYTVLAMCCLPTTKPVQPLLMWLVWCSIACCTCQNVA